MSLLALEKVLERSCDSVLVPKVLWSTLTCIYTLNKHLEDRFLDHMCLFLLLV